MYAPSKMAAAVHMWLFNTSNVSTLTQELNFIFNFSGTTELVVTVLGSGVWRLPVFSLSLSQLDQTAGDYFLYTGPVKPNPLLA